MQSQAKVLWWHVVAAVVSCAAVVSVVFAVLEVTASQTAEMQLAGWVILSVAAGVMAVWVIRRLPS